MQECSKSRRGVLRGKEPVDLRIEPIRQVTFSEGPPRFTPIVLLWLHQRVIEQLSGLPVRLPQACKVGQGAADAEPVAWIAFAADPTWLP